MGRWLIRVMVAMVLGMALALATVSPGLAQIAMSDDANVVIDGRVLFALGSIDDFSAEARTEFANQALWQVLENAESRSIRVRTRQQEGLVTVRANGRHLLTVTNSDQIGRAHV